MNKNNFTCLSKGITIAPFSQGRTHCHSRKPTCRHRQDGTLLYLKSYKNLLKYNTEMSSIEMHKSIQVTVWIHKSVHDFETSARETYQTDHLLISHVRKPIRSAYHLTVDLFGQLLGLNYMSINSLTLRISQ